MQEETKINQKYKLLKSDFIKKDGVILYRIKALIDIKTQYGSIIAKKGDKGGYIKSEDNLSHEGSAWAYGGVILGGVILGGVIRGGVIRGGEIRGGVIYGGEIYDGEIYDGVIYGGVIRGGVIRGGVIRGGVIYDGVIYDGEIYDGVIHKFISISGSRHFVSFCKPQHIKIGCHEFSIGYWLENYEEIGRKNKYTEEEIKEYKTYIDLLISFHDKVFIPSEQKEGV